MRTLLSYESKIEEAESHYVLMNEDGECVTYGNIDVIESFLAAHRATQVADLEWLI